MISALACYQKWIEEPKDFVDWQSAQTRMTGMVPPNLQRPATLYTEGKISGEHHNDTHGRGDEIQAILAKLKTKPDEQFERDVAMWRAYCADGSEGANLALRIFGLLKRVGMLYRGSAGGWGDFSTDFPQVPVASLLSHGGRILFLLPLSHSGARNVGHTIGALAKGLVVDPFIALGNRGTYHTLRGAGTGAAVTTHVALRVTGLASLGAMSTSFHKAHAAGDDRFWSAFNQGAVHDRAMATHSTVEIDWNDAQTKQKYNLGHNRFLWITEEKAIGSHMSANLRDFAMGRHHYKNIALGGVGNRNPFSGVLVKADGCHGHLYVNYRAPRYRRFGAILLGVEGSAPGMPNQFGKAHDAAATRGEYSATGGEKWSSLYPNTFADPTKKSDVTVFVCDMSDLSTSQAIPKAAPLNLTDLNLPPDAVRQADWAELNRRLND